MTATETGRRNYREGYAFEDRVADLYRLLHYRVEHGRIFEGRQVDLFIRRQLGDLSLLRAIECKAGPVIADDVDAFLQKLLLVRREYPSAMGTLVSGVSFTDAVTSHAHAVGVQLTLFRDLAAQLLDGHAYVAQLLRGLESHERYPTALYVEQFVTYALGADTVAAFGMIEEWLDDADWNQLTLLGDVGSGKSFFCRMLALRLANEYFENPLERPFPVLIDLRNAAREFSLEGLILTHLVRSGLPDTSFAAFEYLLSQGRIIVLLDGFDEMAARTTPEVTARNFQELARCVSGRAKVLLTCRTHYFKSRSDEEQIVLGGAAVVDNEPARELYWDLISRRGFRIAYMAPFEFRQIEEFVRLARPADAAEALARIRSTYNLLELSQRPLLLDMVVKSLDTLTTDKIDAATLYGVFTDAWVHRDHWRNVLSPERKLSFLVALARSLWEQDLPSVHYEQLLSYVAIELAACIRDPRDLIEIDAEVRTATFLTRNASGEYGFAHKSYAEFFLARYIGSELTDGRIECLDSRRLGIETIGFLADLARTRPIERLLERTLLTSYIPRVSENALLCLYSIRRRQAEQLRTADTLEVIPLPAGMHLFGANLTGVNLQAASLLGADFSEAQLSDANLQSTELTGANFARAVLINVDLRLASARRSIWEASELDGANLDNGNFQDSSFRGANFGSAFLGDCNMDGANLSDVRISGSLFGPVPRLATVDDRLGEHNDLAERELLERLYPQIQRAARMTALVRQLDPEELASEAVVALLAKHALRDLLGSTPKEQSRYVQWTVTSTALRARNRLQRDSSASSDHLAYLQDSRQDQLDFAIQAELRDRLEDAISQLSLDVQRVVKLRFFEDLTLAEIADREGISRAKAHYRLRGGLRRISELFADERKVEDSPRSSSSAS
jgi:RNA polymerase sigma factor (sigma-70 family)